MATITPNKIVLRSTTNMSLNDRFASIRKIAESTVNAIRQRIRQNRQTSSMNMRLVQQMENRPSVIAALKVKKKSLKQRLGHQPMAVGSTNVKARLSLGMRRGRGSFGRVQRGRGGNIQISSPSRGARRDFGRAGRGKPIPFARPQFNLVRGSSKQGGGRMNFGARRGRGVGNFRNRQGNPGVLAAKRGAMNQFRGVRGSGRGVRGRGAGRGRGSGGWGRGASASNTGPQPSKQQLDNEIDEYMAKTRGALDKEILMYMNQQ